MTLYGWHLYLQILCLHFTVVIQSEKYSSTKYCAVNLSHDARFNNVPLL